MRTDRSWLLGALIASALVGCRDRGAPEPTKRVQDIQESPLRYLDRSVTVIGRVDEVFDDRAFELEGGGIIWPDELLVLTATPVRFGPMKLAADEELVVSGTVRRMLPGEIERELGRSVDGALAQRYRGRAVLIADAVQLVEMQVRWSKPYQQGAIVSAIRLLSAIDPATFAGHAVELGNVPVRAATGQGLWIGFGPRSELFLVPRDASQLAGIEPGNHVAIRGTVREVPAVPVAPAGAEVPPRPELEPARARGAAIYIEAAELTKLVPRPST